jgi:hypothetical protein
MEASGQEAGQGITYHLAFLPTKEPLGLRVQHYNAPSWVDQNGGVRSCIEERSVPKFKQGGIGHRLALMGESEGA